MLQETVMSSVLSPIAHVLAGSAIRTTEDRRFSVADIFVAIRVSNSIHSAEQALGQLLNRSEEVRDVITKHKFPGPGQRSDTKVADEEGIYVILMNLRGNSVATEFRNWAAKIIRERREEETDPELAITRGRERVLTVD